MTWKLFWSKLNSLLSCYLIKMMMICFFRCVFWHLVKQFVLGIYEHVQQKLWLTGQYCVLDWFGLCDNVLFIGHECNLVMGISMFMLFALSSPGCCTWRLTRNTKFFALLLGWPRKVITYMQAIPGILDPINTIPIRSKKFNSFFKICAKSQTSW